MTLLILGLLLWIAAHYFKRLFPAQRAGMRARALWLWPLWPGLS